MLIFPDSVKILKCAPGSLVTIVSKRPQTCSSTLSLVALALCLKLCRSLVLTCLSESDEQKRTMLFAVNAVNSKNFFPLNCVNLLEIHIADN